MKLHQAINGYELDAVWDALSTELARNGDRERIRSWLRSNVNHHLEQQLPHMHDPRIKAPHIDIGLKWSILLTPRDHVLLPPNNMSRVDVLDLFAHPELAEAYHNGCLLYRWHTAAGELDEARQRLSHWIEALQAVHGRKKHWASIDVPTAVKIAEEWVAELNRKKLESGGETEVVWNQAVPALRQQVQPPGDDGHKVAAADRLEKHLIQYHLLKDEIAYKSEGQVMSHCVATYWDPSRTNRKIYSMRNATTGKRLVTIEVSDTQVVQARGYKNAEPTAEEKHLLTRFYEQMGFQEYKLVGTAVAPGRGLGVRLNDFAAVRPYENPLTLLPLRIGHDGPPLFDHITSLDVSHDHHRGGFNNAPTVRIEGIVNPQAIGELQRHLRRG
jgi:hypothetical protein